MSQQFADNKTNMSEDQVKQLIKNLATTFGRPIRSPILRWPHEYDLDIVPVRGSYRRACSFASRP